MPNVRIFTLSWNTASGTLRALTPLGPYLKRGEPVRLVTHVDALIPNAADLSLTVRPDEVFDDSPLVTLTGWTWNLSSLTWTLDAVISSDEIDTFLKVNAQTVDDVKEAPVSLDLRAFDATSPDPVLLAQSDRCDLTLKNNEGRGGAVFIEDGGVAQL